MTYDITGINKKLYKPVNPLIFQTAADMAAVWFEAALSSGLKRGKYVGRGDKPIRMYVYDHLEKFIPLAISTLIEMLKPTSNCNAAMREAIYEALMDPLNDPDLMATGKNNTKAENEKMVLDAIKNFDKRKIKELGKIPTKLDLKSTTVLGNG